ncbi:MAG: METTL5 family protein [archaeon]
MNKKRLAMWLSKIQVFENPDVKLEQYSTDSEIAADLLWNAYLEGDIEGKAISDLGCGPGTFGLGALILGAKEVNFVDIDKNILKVAKSNLSMLEDNFDTKFKVKFFNTNVTDFKKKCNVVIQNPPFGVKDTHHDKLFLLQAMSLASTIYSFHKLSTKSFVNSIIEDNGFKVKKFWKYHFPIKRLFWFHKKPIFYTDVACWKAVKKRKV